MNRKLTRPALALFASVALAGLGACSASDSAGDPDAAAQEKTNETLASVLSGESSLSDATNAFGDAGISTMLDGPASYTVLAPDNAAFEALGTDAADLDNEDDRAILAAVLREHVIPGALTPDSIRQAISDNGGPVEMRTFGEDVVSFAMEGNTVMVEGADGSKAAFAGPAMIASNGVVIPIDHLLQKPVAVQN